MRDEDTDRRLTELEIKASLQEDTIDRLEEVVIALQARIDALARELARLVRERLADGDDASRGSARDEVPPHY